MRDWLAISAQARPQHPALITQGQTWTYGDLSNAVDRLCGWLRQQGITTNQTIGILMPNSAHYVMLVHAALRLGLVITPLNTRLTAEELRYQVNKAHCSAVIASEDYAETAALTSDRVLILDKTILNGAEADSLRNETHPLDLAAAFAIVFTSGTTGQPKGAALTIGNFFYSATASAFRIGTLPDDRWLCPLPLYHVGGLSILLRCALYGTTAILLDRFDLETVNYALDTQAVTLISLVPTMLYRLIESRHAAPPHLRLVLLGGAAASQTLVTAAQNMGIPVATTYGLTEAASQVATQTPQGTLMKPGSVGRAVPFTQIRVLDDQGRPLPQSEIGEVVVSGPTVMQGYFNDSAATGRTLRNGRLHTGDLGYVDADGDLWIVQRRSDLIVTGGENVYPAEVEGVLKAHPAVADVCVVGVEDAEWGQKVTAAVVIAPGHQLTETELTAYARQRLAGYKVPRLIRFIDSLPYTASGKIERRSVSAILKGATS